MALWARDFYNSTLAARNGDVWKHLKRSNAGRKKEN